MPSHGNPPLDKQNIRAVVFMASDNKKTKEQNLYIIFEMQGCDAPTSSSWIAPLSTKTSAWFGLFLLLGLDFIFLLQAHYYAVERETRTIKA